MVPVTADYDQPSCQLSVLFYSYQSEKKKEFNSIDVIRPHKVHISELKNIYSEIK